MAEAIILPIIANSILGRIATFIEDEVKGVISYKDDLKAMSKDLTAICAVLQDAEAKQHSNASMKVWLKDLKDVVYDIDDLFDEVAFDALKRSVNKGHFRTKTRYILPSIAFRFDVSSKLKDIVKTMKDIVARKNDFGLTERLVETPTVQRDPFDASSYVSASAILGRDDAKLEIIERMSGLDNVSELSVLPIVGMGGIGKTALAKLVYNHVNWFDVKIWACVSDNFDIQKVLQDISKGATGEQTSNYTLDQLVAKLRSVLEGKRYLLVLDDLWLLDVKLWMELYDMLNVGKGGSVILITTRIEGVASMTQTTKMYNVDQLPNLLCWNIFRRLAFRKSEEQRYPRLSEIGRSIVENCNGNPLVVQTLGSLLRSEREEAEWARVENTDLQAHYGNNVIQLLKLSYDKLPSHLKPFFSHLSLFPKDQKYDSTYELYYWSALGLFRQSGRNKCDIGGVVSLIIPRLMSRSMVQDVKMGFNKKIISFKMHDLLHDIAREVLGEELVVVTTKEQEVPEFCRHIAWSMRRVDILDFPANLIKTKKVRSFTNSYKVNRTSKSFLEGIISNMSYLRTLNIPSMNLEELPSSIGELKHLRLLNVSDSLIKALPDTICELLNLESLILNGCKQLEQLPRTIYKLINLRYLVLTTRQTSLVGCKFNKLPSLQDLYIRNCKELVSLWDSEDIGHLTTLRSLLIYECPKLSSLPNSMKLLVGLDELRISNCGELNLDGGEVLSGLSNLQTLQITGVPQMSCLPKGIKSASNSLKYLSISRNESLKEISSWVTSFTSLERLYILDCINLLALPVGFSNLKSLQILDIKGCPHLTIRCAKPDGEDFSLIQHIPQIALDGHWLINKRI